MHEQIKLKINLLFNKTIDIIDRYEASCINITGLDTNEIDQLVIETDYVEEEEINQTYEELEGLMTDLKELDIPEYTGLIYGIKYHQWLLAQIPYGKYSMTKEENDYVL